MPQTGQYQVVSTDGATTPSRRRHVVFSPRNCLIVTGLVASLALVILLGQTLDRRNIFRSENDNHKGVTIAFVGNSMFYFNGA